MDLSKLEVIADPVDKRLSEKAKRVKEVNTPQVYGIVDAMKKMQIKTGAVGLAANQLGINRRIITAYHEGLDEILEFINPRLVVSQIDPNDKYWDYEGCLSHPGIMAEVARHRNIVFICQRLKYPGEVRLQASGMIARIIQHEIDHIDGKLITDLGWNVRNVTLQAEGQKKLFDATAKFNAEGQQDFLVD